MLRYSILLVIAVLSVGCNTKQKSDTEQNSIQVEKKSSVTNLPFFKDASFTPHWLTPKSAETKDFHKIPDFTLINQDGDTLTQKTFEDKIYITDFFFTTCPGICPRMTENMSILHKEFMDDKEVLLLSHSVTPSIDSVPVLKEYAEYRDIITDKWHLVTGDREEIYDLGRNHYFVEQDLGIEKDLSEFLHTENFLLIDKEKHIRGIYNGLNKTSINQLIADIKMLKKEG